MPPPSPEEPVAPSTDGADDDGPVIASASERLVFAILFALIEDGLVACSTSFRAHIGPVSSLLAGLEAACFMALPLALVAAPVGWLLDRPTSRTLGRHVRTGLGAGEPEHEGAGVVLFAGCLAVFSVLTWQFGMRIGELQSVRVATLATLAVAILAMAASALVSTWLVGPVARLLRRIPARLRPTPVWLPVPSVLVTAAGVAAMYWFLPASHAITPAAALVGYFVGPEITSRIIERPAGAAPRRAPMAVFLAVSLVLTGGATVALKHLSDAAQLGVLARAPYASILITSIRRLFDHDHDGYSAILGGGDCNDDNADIHPNALDIPANGIDENCSGADAHPFTPEAQPPTHVPPIPNAPAKYNVVLIHVEAVRPDHMSMNGYKRPTTPKIDHFKDGAVWFRDAYSTAPSTRFALSQIFTGWEVPRIPQRRGSGVDYWLLPEATTLAERLAPAGYDTVGYTLSYVLQHIHDVGQGFREWTTPWKVDDWKETYNNAAQLTTDAALKYLSGVPQDGSKPYLLFLHYGATHDPYIEHDPWHYGDSPIDQYDSALNYEDDQLGRLFDALDARGDKDRTVVLLYSDHGELFGEHGFTKHGNTLFQPDVRVMLIAKVPGVKPIAIDAPTALSDLSPTILHLTGLSRDPKSQAWDLVPYIEGAPMPSRTLYFYGDLWRSGVHFENRALLTADGKTKFIHDISDNQNILLDLVRDPGELSNIAGAQPVLASKLSEDLDSWDAFEGAGMKWEDSHAKKGEEDKKKDEEKDKNPGD